MTIIIPMAGLSSRFTRAGYTLPKYMLYAVGRSLFNIAVSSFERYFAVAQFVFVARDMFDTKTFVEEECRLMGIANYSIVILESPTRGQSETVLRGITEADIPDEEDILIFNIDTFRPNFTLPEIPQEWDGYLEVFKGNGANWSYAKTEGGDETRVVETAEKREISDNCSTGIYWFRRVADYKEAYVWGVAHPQRNELYVAPMYNCLIAQGKEIHIHVISRDEVIFCGIPQEYEAYLARVVQHRL